MQGPIATDTETFFFGEQPDGSFVVIPEMICTSAATRLVDAKLEVDLVSDGDDGGEAQRQAWYDLLTGDDILVFHNAAYDLAVCIITFPEFEPLVWEKVERGQVLDTKIREKLLNLSTHGKLEAMPLPDGTSEPLRYSLADLILKHLGEDISQHKEEGSVRTQYHLYSGWPSADYPDEAAEYAKGDASYTLRVFEAQERLIQSDHGRASVRTTAFHVAADLALFLTTSVGMPVDKDRYGVVLEGLQATLSDENMKPLVDAKILRPAQPARPHSRQIKKALGFLGEDPQAKNFDWSTVNEEKRQQLTEEHGIKWTAPKESSVDTKALKAHVEKLWKVAKQKPRLTDTGQISADAEVINDLVAFDRPQGFHEVSPLQCYQNRQEVRKLVTTELPRMTWNDEVADRVYFPFNVLLATGRTSSFASKHYPSGNGQNIDPRARPCYLPEDGCWLLSTDYNSLELCAVGQTVYNLFGQSRHRDLINEGYDLHAFLAAALARALSDEFDGHADPMKNYQLFMGLKVGNPKFFKHWRKFAKPVGLGFPGGLGLETIISIAKKKPYFVDIIAAAEELDEVRLPKWEHTTVAWYGEKFGMDESNWEWTPFMKGIALAALLKDIWLDTFPNMKSYFDWVKGQEDPECIEEDEKGNVKNLLCYTTPLGMFRTGCIFNAAANGMAMQSPSAEGAKIAIIELVKSCRMGELKGRAVFHNFIHDEVILSIPGNAKEAAEVTEIIERIMVESMQRVMPDVRIGVESDLSTRWLKQAEPVYNEQGQLVPWEEGVEYFAGSDGTLYTKAQAA